MTSKNYIRAGICHPTVTLFDTGVQAFRHQALNFFVRCSAAAGVIHGTLHFLCTKISIRTIGSPVGAGQELLVQPLIVLLYLAANRQDPSRRRRRAFLYENKVAWQSNLLLEFRCPVLSYSYLARHKQIFSRHTAVRAVLSCFRHQAPALISGASAEGDVIPRYLCTKISIRAIR